MSRVGGGGLPSAEEVLAGWRLYQEAAGHSLSTVEVRMRIMRALQAHAGVAHPLQLRREHVMAWLVGRRSQWTRVAYFRAVKVFEEYCHEFEVAPELSLTRGLKVPKMPGDAPQPLNDEVVQRLLAAPLSPRPHAYVRLGLFGALRVAEISRVRGEDFDHEAGWLMVRGKGNKLAPVPIHPEVSRLAEGRPEFGWWFPSSTDPNRPVHPAAVTGTIKAAMRSIGCQGHAHQLRHTAATRLLRRTKDVRLVQAMLRHNSVATTQRYAAVADQALQDSMSELDWRQKPPPGHGLDLQMLNALGLDPADLRTADRGAA